MAETKIEWADFTYNPWRGCQKVSPGTLGVWGPMGTRVVAAESYWKLPERWNRAAATGSCHVCLGRGMVKRETCSACMGTGRRGDGSPYRARVFCASLADVFEDWAGAMMGTNGRQLWYADDGWTDEPGGRTLDMDHVRQRLFRLIDATPNLDWLLVTKRPENITRMAPSCKQCETVGRVTPDCNHCYGTGHCFTRRNIWIGTSVENQATADERIPHLLRVPAAVRFLSMEPLLGPVELSNATHRADCVQRLGKPAFDGIHWIIAGGESGNDARPMHPEWVRSIRDQCQAAGVPFFFKQWGEWGPGSQIKKSVGNNDGTVITEVRTPIGNGQTAIGYSFKVGKKAAGRMLDGRTWDELPEATTDGR